MGFHINSRNPRVQSLFRKSHEKLSICRVTRKTLPVNIRRALIDHQSVVVTGRSRGNDRNIPIGKTTAVLEDFVPMVAREGLEVKYFNIGMGLPFVQKRQNLPLLASNMQNAARALGKPADIFVLNEAFHLFGPPASQIYETQMRQHIEEVWEAIGSAAEKSTQFIFISAIHPRHRRFEHFEIFPAARLFTEAPIMEFKPANAVIRLMQRLGVLLSPFRGD